MIPQRCEDLLHYQQSHGYSNEQDEDIIGEEVRPSPIEFSIDSNMRALHALLQDHTYSHMPKQLADTTITLSNMPATQQMAPEITAVNVLSPQTTSIVNDHSAIKRSMPMDQTPTPVKFAFESGANSGYTFTFNANGKIY